MEHWVANVQQSANAQRQRRPGESQAGLAYRMAYNWFDTMINATKAASPKTDTAMFGGYAADNKGCCSGSKLGIFSWEMLKAQGVYSNPGLVTMVKSQQSKVPTQKIGLADGLTVALSRLVRWPEEPPVRQRLTDCQSFFPLPFCTCFPCHILMQKTDESR